MKKDVEIPKEVSKEKATEDKKFIQGLVEFLTIGEEIEVSADSEDEKMSISEFSAVVVSNKIIDFLTGDMQEVGKKATPLKSVNIGDFVLVLDKSEGENQMLCYYTGSPISDCDKV